MANMVHNNNNTTYEERKALGPAFFPFWLKKNNVFLMGGNSFVDNLVAMNGLYLKLFKSDQR